MTRSQSSKHRRRIRRSTARRRDAIYRDVATSAVSSVLNEVKKTAKKREENRYPIRWTFKYSNTCYVCESSSEDVRGILADCFNDIYGWLACPRCVPHVQRFFLPRYTLSRGCLLCPSGIHALREETGSVSFTRRSKSLNRDPFVQTGSNITNFSILVKEKTTSSMFPEDRILVQVVWRTEDDSSYEKCVTLSNIITSNHKFPQTVQGFLRISRNSYSILTRRIFKALQREYLLSQAWKVLEMRIGSDPMDFYGLYSED